MRMLKTKTTILSNLNQVKLQITNRNKFILPSFLMRKMKSRRCLKKRSQQSSKLKRKLLSKRCKKKRPRKSPLLLSKRNLNRYSMIIIVLPRSMEIRLKLGETSSTLQSCFSHLLFLMRAVTVRGKELLLLG